MATKLQIRRGTYQSWFDANPTLADGEIIWDTTYLKFKVGNGVDNWRTLPYVAGLTGATGVAGGGTSGQLLVKSGSNPYETSWIDNPLTLTAGVWNTGAVTTSGQLAAKTTSTSSTGFLVSPIGASVTITGLSANHTGYDTTDTISGFSNVLGLYVGLRVVTSGFSNGAFNTTPSYTTIRSVDSVNNRITVDSSASGTISASNGSITFTGTQQDLQQWQNGASGVTTKIDANGNIITTGSVTANNFVGNGASITNLSGASLQTGSVNVAALSGTVPVTNGGTGVTTATGTGSVVKATSPTLTGATLSGSPTISGAELNSFSFSSTSFRVVGGLFGYQDTASMGFDTTGTLSASALLKFIVTSTTAAAVDATLPRADLMYSGIQSAATTGGVGTLPNGTAFNWSVINTGSNVFTLKPDTTVGKTHTIIGNAIVSAGTSATFRTVQNSSVSFTTYRL
jgi:hypothetical protein